MNDPAASVTISAPSRLHFGLLSFGNVRERQYGGIGVALSAPRWQLQFERAMAFQVDGPAPLLAEHAARIRAFAARWAEYHGVSLRARLVLQRAVAAHVGLGAGTQLALVVARGLRLLYGMGLGTASELAQSVGRGLRSAIGSHAFVAGGLIVDPGKLPEEPLAPLERRICLPAEWTFVLLRLKQQRGLSGHHEQRAFNQLPPIPAETTRRLRALISERLIPAAERGDCQGFGSAVYDYGLLAGHCFSAVQGGPFASPQLAAWVQRLRELGITGVGQTSWGPTLFALTPDTIAAEALAGHLEELAGNDYEQITVAGVCNRGAVVAPSNECSEPSRASMEDQSSRSFPSQGVELRDA